MINNTFLYAEISIVFTLILILLSIKVVNSVFKQEQRRIFLRVSISNITFLIMDLIWIYLNNNSDIKMNAFIWVFDALYYVVSALVGWYWFWYSETIQESKFARDYKYRLFAMFPIFLLVALVLISYKTGWLFSIDYTNHFHRGPAYIFVLLLTYGYVVFTAVKAFYLSYKTVDYHKKIELKTLSMFVIPTIIAGLLQIVFSSYPIICVGNTLGILYVYITLQDQLILQDPLTKLNNRNSMYQTLSYVISHKHNTRSLYLLIMDIDYFKSINDKFGHIEGDVALKKVADALSKVFDKRNDYVFRFGGDEFVVLCELSNNSDLQSLYHKIQTAISEYDTPYSLTLSIGSAKYSPEIKNQQEFIGLADKDLYIAKKNREPKTSR